MEDGSLEDRLSLLLFKIKQKERIRTINHPRPSSPVKAPPGGIDLDPALLDLQIRRDGNGVPLPLPQQPIQEMNIRGFVPVIIDIAPVEALPLFISRPIPTPSELQTAGL